MQLRVVKFGPKSSSGNSVVWPFWDLGNQEASTAFDDFLLAVQLSKTQVNLLAAF